MEEKHLYELISLGLNDEHPDKDSVRDQLIADFGLREDEAEHLVNGGYRMNPLYRDQALHFAKEFNLLGIRTEIRKKITGKQEDDT